MAFYTVLLQGILLSVYVQPRAGRNAIVGVVGDAVKIKITAPPVDGEANRILVRYLAEVLQVTRAHVLVHKGARAKHKVLLIKGVSVEQLEQRLFQNKRE